eukprot:TRINITY_DN5924_c0_g1_i7.p1 TRINITY_DN5924_c0_g1~~TRINITY_DN5924_c0_g1_i7.p1  ORF type:complete len:247 (-),score=36.08 TRINITY_DN5924_c0_g1_i7:25-765(-)
MSIFQFSFMNRFFHFRYSMELFCLPRTPESGQAYGFGSNEYLVLGLPDIKDYLRPIRILSEWKIKKIAIGLFHSVALTHENQVITWGRNAKGQLGLPLRIKWSPIPQIITLPLHPNHHVIDIGAGHEHTLALTNKGSVLGWGSNEFGQLGLGRGQATVPKIIPMPTSIVSFSSGGNHSLFIGSDQKLYGIGVGTEFQLGTGIPQILHEPTEIPWIEGEKPLFTSCGWTHSIILSSSSSCVSDDSVQ